MRESVCLGAFLIPEYLDFHSIYSAPRSRIAEINSEIYSYSGISQTNAFLVKRGGGGVKELVPTSIICTIHLAANSGLCPQFLCGSF